MVTRLGAKKKGTRKVEGPGGSDPIGGVGVVE